MIPITQTIPFEAGSVVAGNCLQAAVASIYELPIEAVPHFAQFEREWGTAFFLYLKSRGFDCIKLHGPPTGGEIVLAFGRSPRGDFAHAVVWRDDAMIHDPHPSGDGLDGDPEEYWAITRPLPVTEEEN
jgi:hypothetical protein